MQIGCEHIQMKNDLGKGGTGLARLAGLAGPIERKEGQRWKSRKGKQSTYIPENRLDMMALNRTTTFVRWLGSGRTEI